ncbi:haloacid dehalogenase type II [Paeniglutamicibacter antarcticus]|uniref:Haloacid dehalogenase type II n=1 Tax=Arthrobacter terrae TaxID=2935737 RepID=A0A931CQA0_9MICC|nr:haloacid dehalogenase type II [Arthrobacter terrae]MBG0739534.1 haloacid dehalogenase type II [Arthrobacter terrae]
MAYVPAVIVFDVNGTLSDIGPLGAAFTRCGMPADSAQLWFTEILRDGFALAAAGDNVAFADIASDSLQRMLNNKSATSARNNTGNTTEQAKRIMTALNDLALHPDATDGIVALGRIAELVTLSNGAASVAEALLTRGEVRDTFSLLLSVQDAPRWKPALQAYEYAVRKCGKTAQEMLLVAVHPWDIHGGHAAGMRTAWINRSGAAYPSYFAEPDIVANDLVSLAEGLCATR